MAAVENSRHNKTAFRTLPFEFGSVVVFNFLVAILETSVTYIMTSFIHTLAGKKMWAQVKCGLN